MDFKVFQSILSLQTRHGAMPSHLEEPAHAELAVALAAAGEDRGAVDLDSRPF